MLRGPLTWLLAAAVTSLSIVPGGATPAPPTPNPDAVMPDAVMPDAVMEDWELELADLFAGVDPGLAWPDGGYRVWMRSSGAGAGMFDGTIGSGMAAAGATFDVLIEGGAIDGTSEASSTEYLMVWRFVGQGGVPGMGSGSIDGTIFERGGVTADGGIVSLIRRTADFDGTAELGGVSAPLSFIPTQDLGGDAVPIIATTARCGFVEGYWLGKLEAMLVVLMGTPSVRASAGSTFVATGTGLVGVDFERLRAELDGAIEAIEAIAAEVGVSDASDRSLAIDLHREISRVENIIAALSSTACGAPGESTRGYGIGLTAAVSNVLARVFAPSEGRTSSTLRDFVSAGARVNALGAGGLSPLNAAGLDRVVEVWGREGDDPDAVLTLAITAATLGDRALADQIMGDR